MGWLKWPWRQDQEEHCVTRLEPAPPMSKATAEDPVVGGYAVQQFVAPTPPVPKIETRTMRKSMKSITTQTTVMTNDPFQGMADHMRRAYDSAFQDSVMRRKFTEVDFSKNVNCTCGGPAGSTAGHHSQSCAKRKYRGFKEGRCSETAEPRK